MSREAYQVPTGGGGGGGFGGGAGGGQSSMIEDAGAPMTYLCGDCGSKQALKRDQPIRCVECGCRVLYKERTKRMVQFEAR